MNGKTGVGSTGSSPRRRQPRRTGTPIEIAASLTREELAAYGKAVDWAGLSHGPGWKVTRLRRETWYFVEAPTAEDAVKQVRFDCIVLGGVGLGLPDIESESFEVRAEG